MEISEIIATLTEGLPADQAAIVKAAIERDAVKAKATGWKQASEYDSLLARQQALQAELEGDPANNKLGAKAYQNWVAENHTKIMKLQEDMAKYQEKYGTLDKPKDPANPNPQPLAMTAEQIQAEVDKRIREQYAPKWSNVVVTTGSIMQDHLLKGRKTKIDFDALAKEADAKYQGDLKRAYEEWDRPEVEKAARAAEDARVEQRVKEEIQKRGASQHFPLREAETPGSLSQRSKSEIEKFDKTTLQNDLVNTFVGASGETVQ